MHTDKPVIGIGACLLGHNVRYNGDSKRQNKQIESLREHADLRAFCPEVAIGLGVPRQTIRLVGDMDDLRLTDSATQSADYSVQMADYAEHVVSSNPDLAGYILVKGSPSCGYQRVKRYNVKGNVQANDASGLFTAALKRLDPLLPLEEDGRLHDEGLRENFVTRVYAYQDWKELCKGGLTHHRIIHFWSRYKYLVLAHHAPSYKQIGRALANAKAESVEQIAAEFVTLLMGALEKPATRKNHSNVLQHICGYLKRDLGHADKRELDSLIAHYKSGIVPLVVPLTLLRHHFRKFRNDYIDQQVFMLPFPEQLGLRNGLQ
jgi:uncharacterized protein YbgA (DUF1722 family)/uncharacterized protein YbbK (DUF523 family)